MDEEGLEDEYNKTIAPEKKMWPKDPSKHPDHKWTMMWEAWKLFLDYMARMSYSDPDNFDMHIYEDFYAYGLMEFLENGVSISP